MALSKELHTEGTAGRVLIAMSGGVDSSMAAVLMQEAGYACQGCTMRLYENDMIGEDLFGTCCSLKDTQDAAAVCQRLGIPYRILHYENEFQAAVIEPFVCAYEAGLTPNPCIDCNRHLKFAKLYALALAEGCDKVVTGHYARIRYEEGRWQLLKAKDLTKDQSYVLYFLTQAQLAHIAFPLGDHCKEEIRERAEALGLVNARKADSQDICFVPDGDYAAFMERYRGVTYPPGDFIDPEGHVVGRHKGAVRYTIGQRRGLGLSVPESVYVSAKDMEKGTVTVGPESDLFHRSLRVEDCNWIRVEAPSEGMRVKAKIRYRQQEQPARLYPLADGAVRVVFDAPQRAITPGQTAVFYDGDYVVGGGLIRGALEDE